jgi:hypothetical protein
LTGDSAGFLTSVSGLAKAGVFTLLKDDEGETGFPSVIKGLVAAKLLGDNDGFLSSVSGLAKAGVFALLKNDTGTGGFVPTIQSLIGSQLTGDTGTGGFIETLKTLVQITSNFENLSVSNKLTNNTLNTLQPTDPATIFNNSTTGTISICNGSTRSGILNIQAGSSSANTINIGNQKSTVDVISGDFAIEQKNATGVKQSSVSLVNGAVSIDGTTLTVGHNTTPASESTMKGNYTFSDTVSLSTFTTGVTQASTDSSTKIATTAFVKNSTVNLTSFQSISGKKEFNDGIRSMNFLNDINSANCKVLSSDINDCYKCFESVDLTLEGGSSFTIPFTSVNHYTLIFANVTQSGPNTGIFTVYLPTVKFGQHIHILRQASTCKIVLKPNSNNSDKILVLNSFNVLTISIGPNNLVGSGNGSIHLVGGRGYARTEMIDCWYYLDGPNVLFV